MSDGVDDMLADLIGRMEVAEARLMQMARDHGGRSLEAARLEAKASGVALARSYVDEMRRRVQLRVVGSVGGYPNQEGDGHE
jgi:hypothetical protein